MEILYFLRKGKKRSTLYACASVNGKRAKSYISTKINLKPEEWNQRKSLIKNEAKQTALEDFEAFFFDLFHNLKPHYEVVTADMVHQAFSGELQREHDFVMYARKWIENRNITDNSKRTYRLHLSNFIKFKGNKVQMSVINTALELKKYRKWLMDNFEPHYAKKCMQLIKSVLQSAWDEGLVSQAPPAIQPIAVKQKPLVFLEPIELDALKSHKFASESLQKAADVFLFQCFTGMAFVDVSKLDKSCFVENNGRRWIRYYRQKSKQPALIPFFPEAEAIWIKYNGKLPLLSNQKNNFYLKEIAAIMGFNKRITTHVGRKTAAMVWLNKGLSIESVAKMLGHSNTSITQSTYAKVAFSRIEADCSKNNLI